MTGEHVGFKERELEIGDFTTLVVARISKSKEKHGKRNEHIQAKANRVKAHFDTANAKIGKVLVWVFKDVDNLRRDLPSKLKNLAGNSKI